MNWLWHIALQKGLRVAAMGLASYLAAHNEVLSSWGASISVDPNALALGILGGMEAIRNYLKVEKGWRIP